MPDETSLQVRRAMDGETPWDVVIERLSPLLRLQAGYRLGPRLSRLVDPEDIIDEVWMAVIPRAGDLKPRDGRWTPVLLRFLSTAISFQIGTLSRKLNRAQVEGHPDASLDPLVEISSGEAGAATRAARRGAQDALWEAIQQLAPRDQEILVMRGVEQRSNSDVAKLLGLEPSAVTMRFQRARDRLLRQLPNSVIEELDG